MDTRSVEKEILGLEQQYWQALKNQDVDTAMRLTDDPCILTGAQGVSRIEKSALPKIMQSATYTLHDFKLDDVQVRMLGNDVAVVAYKVHENLTVDGKSLALDAVDASTWVRRSGNWVCALHTESILGDPFGRDRT